VFKKLTNILGGHQSKKIGEAGNVDGAIEMVKLFVGQLIIDINIRDK